MQPACAQVFKSALGIVCRKKALRALRLAERCLGLNFSKSGNWHRRFLCGVAAAFYLLGRLQNL